MNKINYETHSFQIISRGWMKELLAHVIIESLAHFVGVLLSRLPQAN
jgi:hypothetical protein